jgi:50S ribosomal protein L16 3-hydroxylase
VISPRFDFNTQLFLDEYWQKRPLLIKNALPNFQSPISPEELAGLAMEGEVDSRIVSRVNHQWQLEQGPFGDADFLRDGEWSLLVQRVNEWFPEVDALRGCVDFLPTWRFDDVMVSYATEGAGVGPHFDQYDVFLLQGAGQRVWKVGARCDVATPTIDADGLTLIEEFDADQMHLLSPGDALYIPPGFAHWGTAVGESMTFSIGFRAPRLTDLVARLSDSVIDSLREDLLLEDKESMRVQARPGEITEQHLINARTAVFNAMEALSDSDWFPELLSETDEEPPINEEPMTPTVALVPNQRLLWRDVGDHIAVFLSGRKYRLLLSDEMMLVTLSSGQSLATSQLTGSQVDVLQEWWSLGFIEEPQVDTAH